MAESRTRSGPGQQAPFSVLRHRPAGIGVTLDPQGWIDIDVLLRRLRRARRRARPAGLDAVVVRQRQATVRDRAPALTAATRSAPARATRSPVDLGLTTAPPPPRLFHGTARPARCRRSCGRGWSSAAGTPYTCRSIVRTAQRVGARRAGHVAVLAVDAAAMAAAGHRFQCSANGVWLTEHVPPAFIRRLTRSGRRMMTGVATIRACPPTAGSWCGATTRGPAAHGEPPKPPPRPLPEPEPLRLLIHPNRRANSGEAS